MKSNDSPRCYRCGGIDIAVNADLSISDGTYANKIEQFRVDSPSEAPVRIYHRFALPPVDETALGTQIYRKSPWAIFDGGERWTYLGIAPDGSSRDPHVVAYFSADHTRGEIFSPSAEIFLRGGLHSLTLFPTDQILLARLLADRQGCYLHCGAVIMKGQGFMFAGHSGAGKSTIMTLLKDRAEILCDDRNIVRKVDGQHRVFGTWSHGDIPLVSPNSAPLRAIFFLEQVHDGNRAIPIEDLREIHANLLGCIIRPLVTRDWWEKTIDIVQEIARCVSCYHLEFDLTGRVGEVLEGFIKSRTDEGGKDRGGTDLR